MGMCISSNAKYVSSPTAKLILMDGSIRELAQPVKIQRILEETPGGNENFICSSDGLYVGQRISQLPPEQEIEVGQLYFLLPRRKLQFVLSDSDMASLLLKAHSAIKQSGWKSQGKVQPLFDLDSRDCRAEEEDISSPVPARSKLCVNSAGKRPWKLTLDTIIEAA
eukprot:Gb_29302 [translate_table: standard]